MADQPKTIAFDEPLNIDLQPVAAAYAKAFFNAAQRVGATDTVVAELDDLLDVVMKKYPQLVDVLGSGMFSDEQKIQMVDRAFKGKAHPLLVNLMKVLATHQRTYIMGSIREEVRKLYDKLRGRIPVKVTAATTLSDAQKSAVAARMKSVLGGEPILQTEVDPNLIGGLVVQVGDVVFDGSLASNLGRLREQLINRSVHEIQRRRDRVRTTS
jgi:F-type H+-transporting ATPase subunit delta